MTQKTKVLISFSLLMLTGCYSTQSQNYIVEKSNENSQKLNISTQQDVCNSENKNKKVISRKDEDRCFNQEVLYSELSASYKNKQKLPDCNNKTHPYTWDQCFGKVIGFFYEFEGEFINGKREGFGTLKDNVREYSGEWKNDLPEGIGIFKAHHVSEYGAVKVKGKWEEGFLKTVYLQNFDKTHQLNNVIDQGQFKFTNEILQKTLNFSLYAKYQNIQCFGDDPSIWSYCSKEIYFTNGDKYSGAWKDGKFHGTGTYTYKDSSYYYGEWSLGEKDGSGSFYDTPTKKSVNEYWDYGKKISYEQYKEKLVRNVPKYEITDIRQKRKTFELKIDSTKIQIDGGFLIKILNAKDLIALKINDEDQVLSNSKLLEVKKFAKAGQETVFTIVATDINGNTDTKTITVNRPVVESQAKFTTLNPAQVKKQPERDAVAIIIGIADYKNLPRADFANDDASVFYDYAVRALGIKPENIKANGRCQCRRRSDLSSLQNMATKPRAFHHRCIRLLQRPRTAGRRWARTVPAPSASAQRFDRKNSHQPAGNQWFYSSRQA
jgi:hypothetical protein